MGHDTLNLRRDEAVTRSTALTVESVEVDLDLSESTDGSSLVFPVTSTITMTSKARSTFVDFVGDSVGQVRVNGENVPVRYDGARIQIEGLRVGETNVVECTGLGEYSRTGEGLHRYVDPADGLTYLYTQFEPSNSRRLYPQFDQPDIKASFLFTITAPADWEVLTNEREVTAVPAGTNTSGQPLATRRFAPTKRMSTYVTCVCAGPYVRWDDEWAGEIEGVEHRVPLGMFCRRSLAPSFDPDTLFTTTKNGLDFFQSLFGSAYQWGKYDSIFVPEYNLGAMENPGLVTFTDAGYVFQSGATRSQREVRSNTMLHEMAHMWFGDLVTPAWWDDLWLKESFADYMGTLANAEATEYTDAWTPFAARRKAWAYLQDQMPTTHPIVADIPDVEAAEQNFDGITYAKGASVVKQLVAFVGREAFFEACRDYFAEHAYSSATLPDLLGALEKTSGRDLSTWSSLWLETSGVNTLTPVVEVADGKITRLAVEQGGEPQRPHRLAVGLWNLTDNGLTSTHRIETDVDGPATEITEATGLTAPDLVVLNDDDLTYAKVRLDATSLETVAGHLCTIGPSLTRAGLWASLWNSCRDGELHPARLIDIVLDQAPDETHNALLDSALNHARAATDQYLPAARRTEAAHRLLDVTWQRAHMAEPGSDAQLTWARHFARAAAIHDARASDVRALLDGDHQIVGLALTPELRWMLVDALAATGHVAMPFIDAELARDTTSLAPVRHLRAASSLPSEETKERVWHELMTLTDASNDQVSARVGGFSRTGHESLLDPFTTRYFDVLEQLWDSRSQEIASRIIKGAFPSAGDDDGRDPAKQCVPAAAQAWLEQNPDAPGALRRLVIEGADSATRALRVQALARD